EERVEAAQRSQRAAAAQMARDLQAMEGRLKALPADDRAAVEEVLRAQMRLNDAVPAECPTPRRQGRKTGQRATTPVCAAVRYGVLSDGKPDSEVWVAAEISAWRELDAQKLARFSAELVKLSGCVAGRRRGTDPALTLAAEGFTVRAVDRATGAQQEV